AIFRNRLSRGCSCWSESWGLGGQRVIHSPPEPIMLKVLNVANCSFASAKVLVIFELWPQRNFQRLANAGEGLRVEFKRGKRSNLSDDLVVEAAACLANAQGGTLLLGVEDDGAITGLEA